MEGFVVIVWLFFFHRNSWKIKHLGLVLWLPRYLAHSPFLILIHHTGLWLPSSKSPQVLRWLLVLQPSRWLSSRGRKEGQKEHTFQWSQLPLSSLLGHFAQHFCLYLMGWNLALQRRLGNCLLDVYLVTPNKIGILLAKEKRKWILNRQLANNVCLIFTLRTIVLKFSPPVSEADIVHTHACIYLYVYMLWHILLTLGKNNL